MASKAEPVTHARQQWRATRELIFLICIGGGGMSCVRVCVWVYVCACVHFYKWTTHRQNAAKWRNYISCWMMKTNLQNYIHIYVYISISKIIEKLNETLNNFQIFCIKFISKKMSRIFSDRLPSHIYIIQCADRFDDGVFYTWRGVRYQSLFDMIASFFSATLFFSLYFFFVSLTLLSGAVVALVEYVQSQKAETTDSMWILCIHVTVCIDTINASRRVDEKKNEEPSVMNAI